MKLPKDKYKLIVISIVLYLGWGLVGNIIFSPVYDKCLGGEEIWSSKQCDLFANTSSWIEKGGFVLSMIYVWSSRFRNLFNRNKITKSKDD